MPDDISYDLGVQAARQRQVERAQDRSDWPNVLLEAVKIRDALKSKPGRDDIEEALLQHFNGFLSAWD